MNIKYISSNGTSFELEGNNLRIKKGNFHKYSWQPQTISLQHGDKVQSFKKKAVTYTTTLTFRGLLEERKRILNNLHDAAEYDILHKTPGTIYFGEYYAKCFIISSDTYASEDLSYRTDKDIEIYCPYPSWIQESKKQFLPQVTIARSATGLDFPFDFPFDFAAPAMGQAQWNVEHYASSHFLMTIYGPCVDPIVRINDYPYQIHTALESGDYLTIDSRVNEVTKHLANGTKESLYNSRAFENSVFEKIPSGLLQMIWPGTFGFDITLFLERSEPKW